MSLTVSAMDWDAYIRRLAALNETAAEKMRDFVRKNGFGDMNALIDYAYALATKYGEGAATLAAAMYDAVAELSGKLFEPAIPAETASYDQVAKTVQGVAKVSQNPEEMGSAVGRLVKQAGADTTLQNALRDGAEFAWVPSGDTCAFCITLASRGWQRASKKAVKGGHAEHIHSNCDCTYAIRFDGKGGVAGYDPDKYLRMYEGAEGDTPREKINAMRRENYAEHKEEINAQKRAAYAERKEQEKGVSLTEKRDREHSGRMIIAPADVTEDYLASAKPGTGRITYQPGYDMGETHEAERAGAQWIHDTLGGDIELLKETNGQNEKTPDFLWRDRLWDWKEPSTEKAANSAIRHGLQQIRTNPGGIILNYANSRLDMEKTVGVINKRMQWNRELPVDILIVREGELAKALRYNGK